MTCGDPKLRPIGTTFEIVFSGENGVSEPLVPRRVTYVVVSHVQAELYEGRGEAWYEAIERQKE